MLQVIRRFLDRFPRPPMPDSRVHRARVDRVFHRPHLARQLAAKLLSRSFASGMFLTAPRRTGKSTFVCHDLVPMLESEHNALVLYADLLERQQEDPGEVIVGLVEDALKRHESSGPWPRSLFQSLERLSNLTRKTVVLIVDEAQLMQTTESGKDVMLTLKSALDQFNHHERLMFRVLMTGSHREKRSVDFCDAVEELPFLGQTDYFAWVQICLGPTFTLSLADMAQTFVRCRHRPECFLNVCEAAAAAPPEGWARLAVREPERAASALSQ